MSAPYYADERVTLYLGDCRSVLPALNLTVDCVVADPPYGETSLPWDRWPNEWPSVLGPITRSMWCFGSLRMFLDRRDEFIGWKLSQDVVWEKPRARTISNDRFARSHEHALHWYRGDWASLYKQVQTVPYYGKRVHATRPMNYVKDDRVHMPARPMDYVDNGTRLRTTVLRGAAGDPRRVLHPTQKPLGILDPLISYACPLGGTVLDPFVGSGSTLVAARDSGRWAVGVEADERYAEIAAKRLAQDSLFAGSA